MEQIFTKIYENCEWGTNGNNEYNGSSGNGSTVVFNINTYIPFLKKFISDNNIKTVVDLGCGDFICGPLIYEDLGVIYTGYDAYDKVVEYNLKCNTLPKYNFIQCDFFNKKEEIVPSDLCILKDVIQHWSQKDIYIFLDYLVESKKFKYILIINCSTQISDYDDIYAGGFRSLSCRFFPLKKYNAKKLYEYETKEVSVINCSQ